MSRWEHRDGNYRYIQLDNGLEAVLRQCDCEDAIRLQMVIHCGSNAEQGHEERGLGHGFEHMVFKGTDGNENAKSLDYQLRTLKLSERDIPLIARLFAADFNAYTKTNMTSYYFQVDPAFAKPFLQILACSLDRTRLDEEHFRSEKKAILEEMYAGKDSLVRDALKSMRKAMYRPGDPCYHPTIGYEDSLVNATSVQLKNFYNRNYHPKNATLFVTGNIEGIEEDLQNWIEAMFEPISRTGPVFEYWKMGRKSTPKLAVNKTIKFHTVSPGSANLIFAYRHSGGVWGKAAEALAKVWCGGNDSRLYDALVVNNNNNIGQVTDVECFTDLDYHTGETYFILNGSREIANHIDEWREALQNNILPQLTPREKKVAANWLNRQHQLKHTSLSDITEEWIESHHLARDFDTVFEFDTRKIIAEANSRINSEFMTKPFGWAYVAYPDAEAEEVHKHMAAEHEKYDTILSDKNHMRTAPLEEPHALAMFEHAYSDVDISENTEAIQFFGNGMWKGLSSPAFLSHADIAIFPREHKAIRMSIENVEMSQLAELMYESSESQIYEENGVFGTNSSLLMAVSAENVSETTNFIKKFGLYVNEDEADRLRAYHRQHAARLQSENDMRIKNAQMDPMTVGTDILESQCSDAHYYGLKEWATARKNFNVDKAIATYNKHWTNAVYFVKKRSAGLKAALGGADDVGDDMELEGMSTRYPQPRRVAASGVHDVHDADDGAVITKSIGNVPLQQPIVFLGRAGTMTRADPQFDTVRSVAEIIMFASLGSRLFVHMRERDGDVYNCSGFYGRGATEAHVGYDGVVLKISPGHEHAAAHKARTFLSEFKPVTESELAAAKRMLIHNWKKSAAERNVAGFFVNRFEGSLEDMQELLPRKVGEIAAVRKDDVDRFLRTKCGEAYTATVIVK